MSMALLYALIGGVVGVVVDEVWQRLGRKVSNNVKQWLRKRREAKNSLKARVVRGETITAMGDFSINQPQYEPRPIDPINPPKVMYYRPKRPTSVAFCTNCGDALEEGDKVLMFPSEYHPEIICEGCVKKS